MQGRLIIFCKECCGLPATIISLIICTIKDVIKQGGKLKKKEKVAKKEKSKRHISKVQEYIVINILRKERKRKRDGRKTF